MKTKFTPGPWKIDMGFGDWGMPITHKVFVGDQIYAEKHTEICSIYSAQPYCMGEQQRVRDKYQTDKANAHLIAAAPELYEALEKFVLWSEAEKDHKETTFWGRIEMLRELDAATSAALAKARGEAEIGRGME
jgi:hypothetical protein